MTTVVAIERRQVELAKPCSVDGCDRPHTAKGLCGRHYQRMKNHGDVNWTRQAPARDPLIEALEPTRDTWRKMLSRCEKRADKSYHDYGARGISVCDRWHSFDAFVADMGIRPPGLTIERNDSNGNYEPGNCRWATRAEQNQNTRKNRFLTFRGETLCLRAWARRMGLHPTTLTQRLDLYGWPVEKALTTKPTIGKQPRR